MIEQCGCEESQYWKKLAKKLARKVVRWADAGPDETVKNMTDFQYWVECIAPLAKEIMKTKTEVGE